MVPLGIPYSEFLEWSDEDQDLALEFKAQERITCSSCGTNPDDWFDNDGYYIEPAPYKVRAKRCLGCESLSEEHKRLGSDRKYVMGLDAVAP